MAGSPKHMLPGVLPTGTKPCTCMALHTLSSKKTLGTCCSKALHVSIRPAHGFR